MIDFEPTTLPWVDRVDFEPAVEARLHGGEIAAADAERLRCWNRDGFLHLPGVVAHQQIDALLAAYELAWQRPPKNVRLMVEGRGVVAWDQLGDRAALPNTHYRLLDFQDASVEARELMLHPEVLRVLRLIFDQTPVAMQSLFFEYGSEQHPHQDFPYVQANILSHLVGCWFACQDANADNGALLYYPGSHRLPKYEFPHTGLRWDGVHHEHVAAFEDYLPRACREAGIEPILFEAKKGDVLFWHAALVHAGSPVGKPGTPRRSFVVHYSTVGAYPRDRRDPLREPLRVKKNGGMLYLPRRPSPLRWVARARGGWRRLRARLS
jgi:ectoine hydroxylase-related dioxygenase (phytanoyl-CoA dioxygenase family)